MTPILSVVIPVYNMEATVLHAVCSALDQANLDIEVVVVNDGSTDRTAEVVNALQSERVRIISQANGGIGSALNYGAEMACGKYLYCIGADDWIEPNSLQYAVALMEMRPEIGFVYGSVQYHGDGTWRYDPPPYVDGYFNQHYSAISGYVFRREGWLRGCHWRADTIEDWDHVLQLIDCGYRGAAIPILLFHYWLRYKTGHLVELKAHKEQMLTRLKQYHPAVTATDF